MRTRKTPAKRPKAADLYIESRRAAAEGDTARARELFDLADKVAKRAAILAKARAARTPETFGGRPTMPDHMRTESRSIRLNDARWRKLRALGMDWLSKQIDRAPDPEPLPPRRAAPPAPEV